MTERRRYERTPDTLMLLGAWAVATGLLTLSGSVPDSIAAAVPNWVGVFWSGSSALAALVCMVGVLWKDPLMGWTLEALGRAGMCFTTAGYAAALIPRTGNPGTFLVLGLVLALSFSSAWRVHQLMKRLGEFRDALRKAAS